MNWKQETEYRKEFSVDITWTKKSKGIRERVRFVRYPQQEDPTLTVFYTKIRDTGKPMSSVFNKRDDGVDEGNIWELVDTQEAILTLEEAAKQYGFSMRTIKSTLSKRSKDK